METKRWYDRLEESKDVFDRLKELDNKAKRKLADDVQNVAYSIKTIKREQEELPVSIGLDRVLGLYQQNKCRRWYDTDANLSKIMHTISTLPDEECLGIIEALGVSFE